MLDLSLRASSGFLLANKELYFPTTKIIIKDILLWLLLYFLILVDALGINSKSCIRNGPHTELPCC